MCGVVLGKTGAGVCGAAFRRMRLALCGVVVGKTDVVWCCGG